MADLGFTFNADEVDTSSYELVPDGDYKAVIVSTEKKNTKRNDGAYLSVCFEIVDVVCNGRKLWINLNLWNSNPQAVQIAERDLAAICKATGVTNLSDSSQLENVPMVITVKIKPRKDTGETENRITAYKPAGPQATRPQAQPQTSTASRTRVAAPPEDEIPF